jgi:Spy/CpxP family protein refolding chaperone
MRTRWVGLVLAASLIMNAAFVAVAGYAFLHNLSRPYADTGHVSEMGHHFYQVLGLTPAQLKKMNPMAEAFHKELNRLAVDMASKKASMIGTLSAEGATRERIESQRREMAAVQDKIQHTVIAHILDVKTILDADQRSRFFGLLRSHMTQEPPMFISTGDK